MTRETGYVDGSYWEPRHIRARRNATVGVLPKARLLKSFLGSTSTRHPFNTLPVLSKLRMAAVTLNPSPEIHKVASVLRGPQPVSSRQPYWLHTEETGGSGGAPAIAGCQGHVLQREPLDQKKKYHEI